MSNNSNDEVANLKARLAEKRAAKALRNRQRSPRNNNSNDPTIPLNIARQMALNANQAYGLASHALSRASSRASSPSKSQTQGRRSRAN